MTQTDLQEAIERAKEIFGIDGEGLIEMGYRPSLGKIRSIGKFTAENMSVLIQAAERVGELEQTIIRQHHHCLNFHKPVIKD